MHIGKLIREQVESQGKTVVWLAEQLSCSRANVYKIYEKTSLDTALLMRVCIILNYDFFNAFSELLKNED